MHARCIARTPTVPRGTFSFLALYNSQRTARRHRPARRALRHSPNPGLHYGRGPA